MSQQLIMCQDNEPARVSVTDDIITLRSDIFQDNAGDYVGKWSYLEESFENVEHLTEVEVEARFDELWSEHQFDDSGEVVDPVVELQDAVCYLYESMISLQSQITSLSEGN